MTSMLSELHSDTCAFPCLHKEQRVPVLVNSTSVLVHRNAALPGMAPQNPIFYRFLPSSPKATASVKPVLDEGLHRSGQQCTAEGSSQTCNRNMVSWRPQSHLEENQLSPFVYLIVFNVYENMLFSWKLKVVSSEIKHKSGNLVSWKEPRRDLSSNFISSTIYSMWPWANKMGTVNYIYGYLWVMVRVEMK